MRCRPDEDAGKLLRRALRKSALVHMHAHMHVHVHVHAHVHAHAQDNRGKLLRRWLRESILAPRPRPQLSPTPPPTFDLVR